MLREHLTCLIFSILLTLTGAVFGESATAQNKGNSVDSARFHKMPSGEVLKKYYFVMLKKGPRRDEVKDPERIKAIQQGHMDNMGRMAKLGKLNVAGPFDDDGDWRGIFIFDCNTETEVKELLATDPAIQSGRLAYEIHPWWTAVGTTFK